MALKDFSEFVSVLAEYYELSMTDIANSIEKLAEIQEKYPSEYEEFKKVAENPTVLLELQMDDKIKNIFFEILLKSSSLTQKVNKLISLTSIEKKVLAKDLKDYVQVLNKKLEELAKK